MSRSLPRTRDPAELERFGPPARLYVPTLAAPLAREQLEDSAGDGLGRDDRDARIGEHPADRIDDRRLCESGAHGVEANPALGEHRAKPAYQPYDRVLVGRVDRV